MLERLARFTVLAGAICLALMPQQMFMTRQAALQIAAATSVLDLALGRAEAQSCGSRCFADVSPGLSLPDPDGAVTGPAGTGASMAGQLTLYVNFCRAITKKEYLVDCLAERFGYAAQQMPAYGETAPIRAALMAASRKLGAVAGKYRSADLPAVVLHIDGAHPITTSRPLRPVAPQNLNASFDAALAIVTETETVLLESPGHSEAPAAEFQDVAAVIGSTKVLLRSI